ncbi:hypothetical protein [Rhodohalobacter sp. SW132]|uniref:hypothetical protein n=1 Tax=Rhodohalobacter sp. SW132 TaxID=2293433 RepID=UPI000E22FACE|nr:hypothetical protein [Rhodohalobacter sp. SW132]
MPFASVTVAEYFNDLLLTSIWLYCGNYASSFRGLFSCNRFIATHLVSKQDDAFKNITQTVYPLHQVSHPLDFPGSNSGQTLHTPQKKSPLSISPNGPEIEF